MIKNLVIAVCLFLFASCSNDLETKLNGKWQLQQVEADGNVQHVDTIFFNFQHSLFMFQISNPVTKAEHVSFGFNTIEGDNQLILELTDNPSPVSNFLQYTDWTSGTRTYTIEKSTRKELILFSEDKRYTFRKF